jgi:hypothetical protein
MTIRGTCHGNLCGQPKIFAPSGSHWFEFKVIVNIAAGVEPDAGHGLAGSAVSQKTPAAREPPPEAGCTQPVDETGAKGCQRLKG